MTNGVRSSETKLRDLNLMGNKLHYPYSTMDLPVINKKKKNRLLGGFRGGNDVLKSLLGISLTRFVCERYVVGGTKITTIGEFSKEHITF